jgi:hypothetical protein
MSISGSKPRLCHAVPTVRIRFPPAVNHTNPIITADLDGQPWGYGSGVPTAHPLAPLPQNTALENQS